MCIPTNKLYTFSIFNMVLYEYVPHLQFKKCIQINKPVNRMKNFKV